MKLTTTLASSILRSSAGLLLGALAPTADAHDLIFVAERVLLGPVELWNFDTVTGNLSLRATMSPGQFLQSLDRDPTSGVVYALSGGSNSNLWTVDVNTGALTNVGATLVGGMNSMAFDPTNGQLYALGGVPYSNLYRIDKSTAAATLIGNTSGHATSRLVFDASGQLFGMSSFAILYRVDKATAATALVGGSITQANGFDTATTSSGEHYTLAYGGGHGYVYRIDLSTGLMVLVGDTTYWSATWGVMEAPPACGNPVLYCTGKSNSLGCTPAIGWTGGPSASAPNGFVLRALYARNNTPGILIYGSTGRAATPFGGATLCVNAPVRRTPGVNSAGNPPPAPDCSGAFSVDMNAFRAGALGGNPAAFLSVPGTVVDCQFWGRDPGFAPPSDTQLSNGLEYTVCL